MSLSLKERLGFNVKLTLSLVPRTGNPLLTVECIAFLLGSLSLPKYFRGRDTGRGRERTAMASFIQTNLGVVPGRVHFNAFSLSLVLFLAVYGKQCVYLSTQL